MKILFITRPIAPPWDEGSKNTVFALAKQMRQHSVHLLTTTGFPCNARNIVLEKVYTKSGLISGISLWQKLRLFLRLLKKDDIDIYHFFFKPTPLVATAAKIALKFNRKKTVQTVVSVPADGEQFKKAIFADAVVAGSEFMQKRLAQEGIKSELIYYGVNTAEFSRPYDALAAKGQFGLENSPVILFAGNLHPGKGIEVVEESMEEVVRQFPKVKFVFACRFLEAEVESKNLERIKSKISEKSLAKNAMFLGKIENMKQLISASDIVVFPPNSMVSKMDYPLILLEAMAMGKPVIFSDTPPLDELFDSQSNIMIERDNPKQLSGEIISLFSNPDRMHFMGENAKALAERKFNIESSAQKYFNLYEKLTK